MESGIVDFEPVILPNNVADATCTRGYGYAIDLFSVFTTITYAGYLDKAFLGAGSLTGTVTSILPISVSSPKSGGSRRLVERRSSIPMPSRQS